MPLLSLITFLPLLGVLFLLLIRGEERTVESNAFWMALWGLAGHPVLGGFGVVLVRPHPWRVFNWWKNGRGFLPWGCITAWALMGISLPFVLLSALLTPIVIVASRLVKERARTYMILFLVLETLMIGSFCALDLFLFYIFFEGVLIPMFLIIGIWGGPRRIYATFKFFLYTLAGSLLMLLALLVLRDTQGTSDITWLLENTQVARGLQHWMWLAFFASFAVKIPMWPVHTWLPDAHVEAPTGGVGDSGGGLVEAWRLWVFAFFGADVARSLGGFCSVDFCALGDCDCLCFSGRSGAGRYEKDDCLFFGRPYGVCHGRYFHLHPRGDGRGDFSNGVARADFGGVVFGCRGWFMTRRHSRKISDYGGLAHTMPRYAVLFMVFMLGSVGLPGTSGFIGEFLVIMGSFQANGWLAFFVAMGMVLGALYMLSLYRRVIFAAPSHREVGEDARPFTP